jgi:hypothetical protein
VDKNPNYRWHICSFWFVSKTKFVHFFCLYLGVFEMGPAPPISPRILWVKRMINPWIWGVFYGKNGKHQLSGWGSCPTQVVSNACAARGVPGRWRETVVASTVTTSFARPVRAKVSRYTTLLTVLQSLRNDFYNRVASSKFWVSRCFE